MAEQMNDGELLARFARAGEEVPFQELLQRHGGMVLEVCQRVLGNSADAEDAAQAVFLTLSRKSKDSSLQRSVSLGGWLHKLAWNVAMRARREAGTRTRHQLEATAMNATQTQVDAPADDERDWASLRPVLDEEVANLPEKYRLPFVLCHLESRTQDDAATELNIPRRTLAHRLERARLLLRKRLENRGVVLSVAVLVGLLGTHTGHAALSATFVAATTKAASLTLAGNLAAGAASSHAVALAQQALDMLFWSKLKAAGVACLFSAVVVIASVATYQAIAPTPPNVSPPIVAAPAVATVKLVTPVLSQEIRDALARNATQLSPITISWTEQYLVSGLDKGKVDHRLSWQDGKFHQLRSHEDDLHEYVSDGSIYYSGNSERNRGNGTTRQKSLSIHLVAELERKQPDFNIFDNTDYCFEAAGLRISSAKGKKKGAHSMLLSLLDQGGKLKSVDRVDSAGQTLVRVAIVAPDPEQGRLFCTDLDKIEFGIKDTNSAQVVREIVESIRHRRALPRELIYEFDLDPKMSYAVVRREERYEDGRVIHRATNSDFRRVEGREVWLPYASSKSFYSYTDPLKVSEFGRNLHLSAVDVSPIPDERFSLNYNQVGALVMDLTVPDYFGAAGGSHIHIPLSMEKASKDPNKRNEAVNALGYFGGENAFARLQTALADTDPKVRASAALWITRVGNVEAVPLVEEALSDADRTVRANAAKSLWCVGGEKALLLLEKALGDKSATVRSAAATSLAFGKKALSPQAPPRGDKAVALLEKALADPDDGEEAADDDGNGWPVSGVQAAAADALGRLGDGNAIAALERALASPSAATRSRVLHGLGLVEGEQAQSLLVKALADPVAAVRRDAAKTLANTEGEKAYTILFAALKTEKDKDVRVAIVKVLKSRFGTYHAVQDALKGVPEFESLESNKKELPPGVF